MSIKRLIFQKGGIGTSMSRRDTIARLNPLIREHMALNHAYDYALEHLGETDLRPMLHQKQRLARTDVGKLAETVLSCGGIPYSGVDMEPSDFALAEGDDALLFELLDRERAFLDGIKAELNEPHQLRTEAILNVIVGNSEDRLDLLRELTKRRHRPRSVAP